MKSFRDLRVWQKALDLIEQIYLTTQQFPREEIYGLPDQASGYLGCFKIAEGHTRDRLKEYLHHVYGPSVLG